MLVRELSSADSVSHDSGENVIVGSTYHSSPDKRYFPSDPDTKESKGIKDPEIVATYLSDSNHIVIPVSIPGVIYPGSLRLWN